MDYSIRPLYRQQHGDRLVARLVSVAFLAFFACHAPAAGPADSGASLTGSWETGGVPSGALTSISLQASDGRVTGSGHHWGILRCLVDSFTVSGQYAAGGGTFALTLSFSRGSTGTFLGQLLGTDSLQGTWTSTYFGSYPLTFYPVPYVYTTGQIRPCNLGAGAS
jgi:hypothetical protein